MNQQHHHNIYADGYLCDYWGYSMLCRGLGRGGDGHALHMNNNVSLKIFNEKFQIPFILKETTDSTRGFDFCRIWTQPEPRGLNGRALDEILYR